VAGEITRSRWLLGMPMLVASSLVKERPALVERAVVQNPLTARPKTAPTHANSFRDGCLLWKLRTAVVPLPICPGDLNGSLQHSGRTELALKTKVKSLARVRPAGTLPWPGCDRVLPADRFFRERIVASTD